jgi:Holliday junction DNA helicase RuvA
MIAYLDGTLLAAGERSCLVLTPGGVGYEVGLTVTALSRLPKPGEPVRLFVLTVVREDALELYGFETFPERQMFAQLLTVSKLGPKKALAILSIHTPDELRHAVANEDVAALSRVPGIGAKSALQMLLELKFKLKAETFPGPQTGLGGGARSVFRDALAGLTNLGYSEDEARAVLDGVLQQEPDLDVAEALRKTLKGLAARRK